jgi:hypothetical protein
MLQGRLDMLTNIQELQLLVNSIKQLRIELSQATSNSQEQAIYARILRLESILVDATSNYLLTINQVDVKSA